MTLDGGSETTPMVIKGSDVGIGTANPQAQLDVTASNNPFLYFTDNLGPGGTNHLLGGVHFRGKNASSALKSFVRLDPRINTATAGSEIGELRFWTLDGGSETTTMTIKGDSVGIGTNVPTERLQVEGNIKLNGNITSDGEICIGSGC